VSYVEVLWDKSTMHIGVTLYWRYFLYLTILFIVSSGHVRQERVNKWPNSMTDIWWWWFVVYLVLLLF